MRDSHKPDPVPELHTREEVIEYLTFLLIKHRARIISTEQLVAKFVAMRYDWRSMSDVSVQGKYYGMRIDIRIPHGFLRKSADKLLAELDSIHPVSS